MNIFYHTCGRAVLVRDLPDAPAFYQRVAGEPAGAVEPISDCPRCGALLLPGDLSRTPQGAGDWENMTAAQRDLFTANRHLVPAAALPDADGDWLALDNGPAGDNGQPVGPYVVTAAGLVQGVNYHYRYYHGLDVPAGDPRQAPPSLTGPAYL